DSSRNAQSPRHSESIRQLVCFTGNTYLRGSQPSARAKPATSSRGRPFVLPFRVFPPGVLPHRRIPAFFHKFVSPSALPISFALIPRYPKGLHFSCIFT